MNQLPQITSPRARARVATLNAALLLWAGLTVPPLRAQSPVSPAFPPSTLLEVLTVPAGPVARLHGSGSTAVEEQGTAVRVRPEALAAAAPGERLRLDLAPGVSAVGVVVDVHRTLLGRLVVSGRVAGRPGGRFTFVANGTAGEVVGRVRLGAGEVYRLSHPAGGGPGLEVRRQGAPAIGCGNDDEAESPAPLIPLLPHARALAPSTRANAGPPDDPGSFDLLIVYTAAARQAAGGTEAMEVLCELALESCNEAYANSGLALRGRLVHTMESAFAETGSYTNDLAKVTGGTLVAAGDIAAARDQYGADFVSLFVAGEGAAQDSAIAGLGYLNAGSDPGRAFTICNARTAPELVLAHEIGHNMGCAHDAANAVGFGTPAFPFSYGWRWTGQDGQVYHDVMAYAPGTPEPFFSSPLVTFQGVPTGDPLQADNARTIAQNASAFANYRRRTVGARPILSLTAPDPEAIRATGKPARLSVTRAGGDLSVPLTVSVAAAGFYAVGPLAAVAGTDFLPPAPTVTIPAGSAAADVLLLPGPAGARASDPFINAQSNVRVALLPNDSYELGNPPNVQVFVFPTDNALALSAPEPQATLVPARPARLTVSRRGDLGRDLPFNLGPRYSNGVAPAGFTVIPAPGVGRNAAGEFILTAGQPSADVLVGVAAGATLPDAGQSVTFALQPSGAINLLDYVHVDPLHPTAAVLLLPAAAAATVNLTAGTATVTEGGAAVNLRFIRSGGDLSADLTVAYKVSGAATTGGARLTPLSGTVVIPAGSAKAKVKLRAVDDGVTEGPQGLKVKVKAGPGYVLGDLPRVTLTVLDPQG